MIKSKSNSHATKSELLMLANVGPATLKDLHVLGITTVNELRNKSPDDLYLQLQELTGVKQDPCVWDVFAAIIHEAQTGEKVPWFHLTKIRKSRNV